MNKKQCFAIGFLGGLIFLAILMGHHSDAAQREPSGRNIELSFTRGEPQCFTDTECEAIDPRELEAYRGRVLAFIEEAL